MGGADFHAFAAADAKFRDHRGTGVHDADGFAVAVPDAFVAVLTFVFDGVYRKLAVHCDVPPV
ncbi:hypothetical protein SDC9_76922 [bioreactor metagenome]|uniref:Uncharacterized protein n=1 Tax=bioreactor metagenome TaxID=1076179 RepID=A0A644YWI1_9ZZZZ